MCSGERGGPPRPSLPAERRCCGKGAGEGGQMRSDTCPRERPVSQKPAPVTVLPRSRPRAKVAPRGKAGKGPG